MRVVRSSGIWYITIVFLAEFDVIHDKRTILTLLNGVVHLQGLLFLFQCVLLPAYLRDL
jgi:predicted transporter